MDIRELKYFIEIAKTQNLTQSSSNLFVSQPALSKALKKMEVELGVKLMERSGKRLVLTSYGTAFFEHALEVTNAFDNIFIYMDDIKGKKRGNINMAVAGVVAQLYLQEMIIGFNKRCPEISLNIIEDDSTDVLGKLRSFDMDLALLPQCASVDSLLQIPIFRSEIVAIMPWENSLSALEYLQYRDLQNQMVNILNADHGINALLKENCSALGFDPFINRISTQWDQLVKITRVSKGLALLPRPVIASNKYPYMCVRPFRPSWPWVISIVMRKNNYISNSTQEWISYVHEYFSRLPSL